jgi:hypothetical protein
VTAYRDALHGLLAAQDRFLTLGLTFRGVVPASDSVIVNDAARQWIISLLVRTLAHGVP